MFRWKKADRVGGEYSYYLFTAQRAREDDKSQRQRCPTMQLSTALVAAEKKKDVIGNPR